MSAPLVVNTRDGVCWTRRTVTSGGIALYAPERVKTCPEFVMATIDELAEQGIVGSADVLPMPVSPEPEAALPWAHVMADDDLHLFLDDLVSAALNRWRTEPDGTDVPDRVTLTLVEKACAKWRTPGQGNRSDEPERDPVDELIGANLSLYEEELVTARLRLALESAKRGRREARAHVAELEHYRTAFEAQRSRAETLDRLLRTAQARVAALEARLAEYDRPNGTYPPALPWAALMDDEDLSDFLDDLAGAAGTPGTFEGALATVENTIAQWRVIGEAQHAHNTAPGPNAEDPRQPVEWCTGCNTDHNPDECGYRPKTGGA